MANSVYQDVFRFRALRSPQTPSEEKWFRRYSKDNYIKVVKYSMRDFQNKAVSPVGGLVFDEIVCKGNKDGKDIIDKVLNVYGYREKAGCSDTSIESESSVKKYEGIPYEGRYSFSVKESDSEIYTWYLSHTIAGFSEKLDVAAKIIESHLVNFDKKLLICQLQNALGVSNLSEYVFKVVMEGNLVATGTGNTNNFKMLKGQLFDLMYFLFIAKRRFAVSLDHITRQIQTLHVIEYLGYDDFAADKEEAEEQAQHRGCMLWFRKIFQYFKQRKNLKTEGVINEHPLPPTPPLQWKNADPCDISAFTAIGPFVKVPFINNKEDLLDFYTVQPIIDPIFARLQHYFIPFNDIRPVGIADLKIVKQVLVRYEAGEIAHIENVLKGENKQKVNRRLDTIETFISDETERETETTRENQTTERYEMQRETERTINDSLNANADATVQYDGPSIDVTATGGVNSDHSTEDSTKNAEKFAKEIMNKSVEKITQRVRSLRTTRRTSEIEETNTHGLDNVKGVGHVRGIYRYVNKRYKAQLFNYGRRMMFEFMVPEPADFYVLSKIKGYELFDLECVKKANNTVTDLLRMPINNSLEITKDKYNELKASFDLSAFGEYPEEKSKTVPLTTQAGAITGTSLAEGSTSQAIGGWGNLYMKQIPFKITEKGYNVKKVIIFGKIAFHYWDNTNDIESNLNKFEMRINNVLVPMPHQTQSNPLTWLPPGGIQIGTPEEQRSVQEEVALPAGVEVGADGSVIVDVLLRDAKYFNLNFSLEIEPKNDLVTNFQKNIYNKIKSLIDDANATKQANADTANATEEAAYQKKLEELKKIKIQDIIQGKSEQFNREFIQKELRRQSLSMITKAFDSNSMDNPPISDYVTADSKPIEATHWGLAINDKATVDECVASFRPQSITVDFSTFNFENSQRKGRYVQFLENAFEWQKISYVLYPYFWANESKWIDMLHRDDRADPNMSAFLQAGYARVLVPVRPAFEAAVLHFLYTREPWNGGPAPVIGDDLYLPIHEELRNQTDEYYEAVPEGEPWEYVLPTSLIYLQEDGNLPVFDENFPVNLK